MGEEVLVLGVALDVAADVRALGDDLEALGAGLVEHVDGELGGQALALVLVADAGVDEDPAAVRPSGSRPRRPRRRRPAGGSGRGRRRARG